MADRPRERRSAGVTMAPGTSRGKSVALLALAASLACVALLVLFGRPPSPREPGAPPVAAGGLAEEMSPIERPPEAPAPAAPSAREAEPAPRAEGDAATASPPKVESAPSVPSGIGLFPPPGSDPLKVGIVVPDDFELPEGFLRHHQVTDDGQELEPILLFHPDYELLDDAGQPLPLPEDRVVPPEHAPPGLPIRMLELPPALEESGP